MGQLRKEAIGAEIRITVMEGVSPFPAQNLTIKTLLLQKPSGEVLERAAAFQTDGTDGKFVYETAAGDLDEAGPWTAQLHLVSADGSWDTEPFLFNVAENIAHLH
jgi:hypothetical protein